MATVAMVVSVVVYTHETAVDMIHPRMSLNNAAESDAHIISWKDLVTMGIVATVASVVKNIHEVAVGIGEMSQQQQLQMRLRQQ